MAKKSTPRTDSGVSTLTQDENYEAAIVRYKAALDKLRKRDFVAARTEFTAIADEVEDEPVLSERCRTYSTICDRRLAPPIEAPTTSDGYYHRGVVMTNDGRIEEAIKMFDEALKGAPGSAKIFYARSSAWALGGKVDIAIGDLRQAIATDPQIRFQAANDPDFDNIREEPAFIDIIEPTPSGV